MAWRNRIESFGEADPRELLAHPLNARQHGAEQTAVVRALLDEFGWVDDVVVSVRTRRILNGHLRVRQAIAEGLAAVPVKWVDLNEVEELQVVATYDALGAAAELDRARLEELHATASSPNSVLEELLAARRPKPPPEPVLAPPQPSARTPRKRQKRVGKPVTVAVGPHRFEVAAAAWKAWRAALGKAGKTAEARVKEVRRRLGL